MILDGLKNVYFFGKHSVKAARGGGVLPLAEHLKYHFFCNFTPNKIPFSGTRFQDVHCWGVELSTKTVRDPKVYTNTILEFPLQMI